MNTQVFYHKREIPLIFSDIAPYAVDQNMSEDIPKVLHPAREMRDAP
jgi:hypothetical protein